MESWFETQSSPSYNSWVGERVKVWAGEYFQFWGKDPMTLAPQMEAWKVNVTAVCNEHGLDFSHILKLVGENCIQQLKETL